MTQPQPNPAPAQPGQQPTPPAGQAPASGPPQYPQQPQGQPGQVPAQPTGQPPAGQPPAPPAWPQPYPGQVPGPYGQPAYPPPYGPPGWPYPQPQPGQGWPGQAPGQPPPAGQPQQAPPAGPPAPSWTPPPPPPPGPPAGPPPAGQPVTGPAGGDDPAGDGGRDISGLPQWAQQQITALRKEAADRRVAARTATVGQHAYQVATQAGVNPAALLGSTAWAAAAAQLDPNAADYGQRLTWTVQSLLAANPWMATPTTPPGQPGQPPTPPAQSGGDFGGGTGAGTPITEQQLAQMTPEEIDKALTDGKLKHLL